MKPIEIARQRVAARTAQPYNQRAILNGDWDTGRLVQDELRKIEAEQQVSEAA